MKNEPLAVLYYSHRDIPTIGKVCRRWIDDAAAFAGVPVVAITPYQVSDCPDWQHLHKKKEDENGHLDGYKRLLAGCKATEAAAVAVVEHDVAYPVAYFADAINAARYIGGRYSFTYNLEVYRMDARGFYSRPNCRAGTMVTSNLVADRLRLVDELETRIKHLEDGSPVVWGEPGRYWAGFDAGHKTTIWRSGKPVVDIRYGGNLTGSRDAPDGRYFPHCGPWELAPMLDLLGMNGENAKK